MAIQSDPDRGIQGHPMRNGVAGSWHRGRRAGPAGLVVMAGGGGREPGRRLTTTVLPTIMAI